MPFVRPTLPNLVNRIITAINDKVKGANAYIKQSFFNVMAKIVAALHLDLYAYQDQLARNFFITTADLDGLIKRGGDIGVNRKLASFAQGNIIIRGDTGIQIPKGTYFTTQSKQQYQTQIDAIVGASGSVLVPIIATSVGPNGNQTALAEFTLVNPIIGILSLATADANGITGGADIEGVEEYRARILKFLKDPPGSGDPAFYENAALARPGVTRAKCFRTYSGAGTVGITFMMDNTYPNGIPADGDIAMMQAYLESIMPADVNQMVVFAPTPTVVNIQINNMNPDTPTMRANMVNGLSALFKSYEFGETVYKSQIEEAITSIPEEISHSLVLPENDVQIPTTGIAVLGTITYGV